MSSLVDRRRGALRLANAPENFAAVLALGFAGLFLGAALSYWLDSAQLLRNGANPI